MSFLLVGAISIETKNKTTSKAMWIGGVNPIPDKKFCIGLIGAATTANMIIKMLAADGINTSADTNIKALSIHRIMVFLLFIFSRPL